MVGYYCSIHHHGEVSQKILAFLLIYPTSSPSILKEGGDRIKAVGLSPQTSAHYRSYHKCPALVMQLDSYNPSA